MVSVQERPLLSAVGHPVLLMACTIHLPSTTLPYSSSPYTSFSFHDSRTLGRLISNRTVIKALQPGLVVNPVLDLFWDAIICCVITSSVSPSVTARAWSELDAGG